MTIPRSSNELRVFSFSILTLGPSFNIDLEGIAALETDLDLSMNIAYNIHKGQFIFPPDQGNSSVNPTPAQTSERLRNSMCSVVSQIHQTLTFLLRLMSLLRFH